MIVENLFVVIIEYRNRKCHVTWHVNQIGSLLISFKKIFSKDSQYLMRLRQRILLCDPKDM